MEILKELLNSRPVVGRVEWIGIAKASRDPMQVVQSAKAIEQFGLDGEHHGRPNGKSKRQVTFIQQEHLASLRELGVDLTSYLTQHRADQVIELRGQSTSPHLHIDRQNPNKSAQESHS